MSLDKFSDLLFQNHIFLLFKKVAKKREEWDAELKDAVRREANEQKRIHQVRFLRVNYFKSYSFLIADSKI